MEKKILANDGMDRIGREMLEQFGFSVITENFPQDKLAQAINENKFSALIVRSATQVRKELIDACPGLRLIARAGVGLDNIDADYAKAKGIEVANTPAASSLSVAELVFAHLFGLVRSLHDANRQMPLKGSAEFSALKKKYSGGTELAGKTLGIIGFGRIGQAVARIALALNMKVAAHDPLVKTAAIALEIPGNKLSIPVHTGTLDETLRHSDFITLHVPGGKIITEKEIARMKDGVYLLNAARGGAIDEAALLAGLNSGKIAGAGLDVFENEPAPRAELVRHPKVSLSPHIGAATKEAQQRIATELAEKIIRFFNAG